MEVPRRPSPLSLPAVQSENIRTYSPSAFFSDGEGAEYWEDRLLAIATGSGSRSRARSSASSPNSIIAATTSTAGASSLLARLIDKLMIWDTATNFAFADGHVERYKWAGESPTDPAPIEEAFMRPQTNVYYPGPDWDWISSRLFLEAACSTRLVIPGRSIIRRLLLGGLLLLGMWRGHPALRHRPGRLRTPGRSRDDAIRPAGGQVPRGMRRYLATMVD